MNKLSIHRCDPSLVRLLLIATFWISSAQPLSATDYFPTLGDGDHWTGNQASLEANVVFFQQVLTEQHRGPRKHN